MLKLLPIFLLCALAQLPAANGTRPSCPIENAASAEQRVWLLCGDGRLYVTDDQGITWQALAAPAPAPVEVLSFLDARRGFVAGESGTLLMTEDGGKNWRLVAVPVKQHLKSIFFRGDRGWISGWDGVMLHSEDGGRTWTRQKTGVPQALESVYFADDLHGWAVGWIGTIVRTTDGGVTWSRVDVPAVLWSMSSVFFRDVTNGWIVGFNGQILRSRDGGLTWTLLESGTISWLTSIRFDSSGRGWITAEDRMLTSTDGGETWKQDDSASAVFLRRLLQVNDSMWAVGSYTVIKQAPGGAKWEIVERVSLSMG